MYLLCLILTPANYYEKIVCGPNDKMSKNTIMIGFLLFKEMQIFILYFFVGHIPSYFDLKLYANTYPGNMYMHELFQFLQKL
jgi:hypothetical protein